jgi:chemotaxis family two-component system sensor kinase Cph1
MTDPGRMTPTVAEHGLGSGTAFELASDAAYVMDPERDRILAANEAGCRLLGYTREELLATPISSIHPAELPELGELLDSVLRDGRASTIKLTCRTKQGTFLPTEISLHALEVAGRLRILGLVLDRSEHRDRAHCR